MGSKVGLIVGVGVEVNVYFVRQVLLLVMLYKESTPGRHMFPYTYHCY